VADASFNGTFAITVTSATTFTYSNTGADGPSSGGQVQIVGGGTELGGSLYVGGFMGPNAHGPGVVLPNAWSLIGANAAGTDTVGIARMNEDNSISLGISATRVAVGGSGPTSMANVINLLSGSATTGTGAVAVLGAVGGTGRPTNNTQAGWQQFQVSGVNIWVPYWT